MNLFYWEENLHYFDKIKTSFLLTEIFVFLNLSNIKTIMYVNRRFRKHLMKNDCQELRRIGNYTYRLDKYKDFEGNPRSEIKIKAIKSNIHPVEHMVLMNDVDLIAASPGTYEEGIIIWRQSTAVYENEIRYKDLFGQRGFICCLFYVPEHSYLVASYTDGDVFVYNMNASSKKGEKIDYLNHIVWQKKIAANEQPIKKMAFNESKSQLITLEIVPELFINLIKVWNILNGEHLKSAVFCNLIITSLRCYEIMTDDEEQLQSYLVLGLSDGKIALKCFDELEKNYSEIIPNYYFYGHEGAITDTLYMETEQREFLISCSQDLYIFFWDLKRKVAIQFTDSLHEDQIINLCYIDENVFATCSKDRTIMLWGTSDCSHLQTLSYHTSTINSVQYNPTTGELFSNSYDKMIRSVKLSEDNKSMKSMKIINGHTGNISSAKLDYVSQVFITAGTDKSMKFWDFKNMELIKSIDTKNEYFDDFILLYDDFNTIIKVDMTKKIKCLDTKNQKFYNVIDEVSPARSILNLYDAVSFLVGLSNSEISFYNYYTVGDKPIFKKKKTLLHGPVDSSVQPNKTLKIKKLIFLDYNQKIVASGASDGSVCVFYINSSIKKYISPKTDKEVDCICPITFNPVNSRENVDEKAIFAFASGVELYIYDLINDCIISHLFLGKISCIDRLNDDYLILSLGDLSNDIQIYDTNANKIVNKNVVSFRNIRQIYYMKDGKRVIVTSGDNGVGFSMDVITFGEESEF